jgi:hypothetical protein
MSDLYPISKLDWVPVDSNLIYSIGNVLKADG